MAADPATVAAKWARNLSAAGDSIRAGVAAVNVAPTQKAAARVDAYVQGVARAAQSGKFQRGLNRVSLQSWQDSMVNKGLPRVASGATAAKDKVTAFLQKWLPYQDQLKSKLASMPRGDLQTNIQRAITAMEHNAAFVYQ
jgi:hypothetical protein